MVVNNMKLIFGTLAMVMISACGKSGTGAGIPLVKPPVVAATPASLVTTMLQSKISMAHLLTDSPVNDLKARFYPGEGPTDIGTLLGSIDNRINEINTRSAEDDHACLSATPVSQVISVFGESVTAYFQCYDVFSDGTGGMLFGKNEDTWYIYEVGAVGSRLVTATPVAGESDKYVVEARISVGVSNSPWQSMSYGIIHLKANSSTGALDVTAAGSGLGFTSAYLQTDGTNISLEGDTGGCGDPQDPSNTTWASSSFSPVCVLASDLATAGSCSSLGSGHHNLTILGVSGHSTSGDQVIDGSTNDAVHFGPSVAGIQTISGVSQF